MQYALPCAMTVILGTSALGRNWHVFKTVIALLANWGLNSSFVYATSIQLPWYFFGTVDYLTAIALLGLAGGRFNLIIVMLYAVEMLGHSAFAFSDGGPWPQYRYFYLLFYIAWAQTLLCGGWLAYGMVQGDRRSADGMGRAEPVSKGIVRSSASRIK